MGGVWHGIGTPMAILLFVTSTGTATGGIGTTTGWTMIGTTMLPRPSPQLSSFLSHFIGRVLFDHYFLVIPSLPRDLVEEILPSRPEAFQGQRRLHFRSAQDDSENDRIKA